MIAHQQHLVYLRRTWIRQGNLLSGSNQGRAFLNKWVETGQPLERVVLGQTKIFGELVG